ncbi:MAG: hypothetical protein LUI60_08045 [Clostridia bacterium]|nr:hypothetical protein [Clostridia bacterium]
MATKKTTDAAAESGGKRYDNSVRRWTTPSKRAKSFASERKAKVHQHGDKEGKELTDYESGIRSGYLLCQSDHAGQYIYSTAIKEGKSKEEATKLSRTKGKFRKNKEEK